ncbi:DUF2167 domain-containing protein [soil metagenome]
MKKMILLFSCLLFVNIIASAQKLKEEETVVANDSVQAEIQAYLNLSDSVINAMKYQQGIITLKGDFAKLNIPAGFKFLNAEQSQYILHDVWGNPERPDVLGMIFSEDGTPYTDSSYVFVVSFDDMGYVKDDDAKETDYDELLKQMQDDEAEENKQRVAAGYSSIHMAGWAQKPFYDDKRKVLHWAKDLLFSDADGVRTLNYDVRVLGRKGVLSLNAIASMSELPLVKANIDKILTIASFTEGNAYADFDDNTDKIAAYTIGGLVAGKILAKVGLWAVILKFWKLIAGGLLAAFYGIRKWLTGRKKPEEELSLETISNDPDNEPQA